MKVTEQLPSRSSLVACFLFLLCVTPPEGLCDIGCEPVQIRKQRRTRNAGDPQLGQDRLVAGELKSERLQKLSITLIVNDRLDAFLEAAVDRETGLLHLQPMVNMLRV